MKRTKTALLLLGMHRSGTSVSMRVCRTMGVDLGLNLLPAQEDNPTGFWEHADIVDIHERFLAEVNLTWHDTVRYPSRCFRTKAAKKAQQALREVIEHDFNKSLLWGVKDPRLCRLLPLWKPLLRPPVVDQVCCLIVWRNPFEVAASLSRRDEFPLEKGLKLWLYHLLDSEKYSYNYNRYWLNYDDLLTDPSKAVERIQESLRLPLPNNNMKSLDVESLISPNLKHHHVEAFPAEEKNTWYYNACVDLMTLLKNPNRRDFHYQFIKQRILYWKGLNIK